MDNLKTKEREFSKLIVENERCLYWVLGKVQIIDRHEADDYLQEMRIYAWHRFLKFEPAIENFGTWLIQTCLWAARSYRRKQRAYLGRYVHPESLPDFAYETTDNEDNQALRRAVSDLCPNHKAIAELYLAGFQPMEIAQIFSLTTNSVSSQLNVIRSSIRKKRHLYFGNRAFTYVQKEFLSRRNENNNTSKRVYQYSQTGELIKIWPSTQEARREGLRADNGAGKRGNLVKGYIFSFKELTKEECQKLCEKSAKMAKKPIAQFDMNGQLVRTYSSKGDVGQYGFSVGNVHGCLKGTRSQHKGYVWKYLEQN